MQEVKLAKAEVKALCHYAKTEAMTLAQRSTRSDFTLPGQQSVADKRCEEAAFWTKEQAADLIQEKVDVTREMLGALDVFGILSVSLWPFDRKEAWAEGVEAVHVAFSEDAMSWLAERHRELGGSLDARRATSEINGGTRNETFVLFALNTVAEQVAAAPELKAAA